MNVADLPQIDQDLKELLEAVGCLHVTSLAAKDPASLHNELVKANNMLKITNTPLELVEVEKIVLSAAEWSGVEPAAMREEFATEEEPRVAINIKGNEHIEKLLEAAPVAKKLKAHLVRSQNIAVSDIPKAILLNNCDGSVKIKTEYGHVSLGEIAAGAYSVEDEELQEVSESLLIDGGEVVGEELFHDFDAINNGEHHVKPLDRGAKDVVDVSPDLNKNVSGNSRRYIKGVLHPDPWRIKGPSMFVILVHLALAANLLGQPYLFIFKHEDKVNLIAAGALFGFLIISAGLYLIIAGMSSCRVCGQKQFRPKLCIKHTDAHRLPLLGHILPTALHALLFRWFYCIYCGTAIRLKK